MQSLQTKKLCRVNAAASIISGCGCFSISVVDSMSYHHVALIILLHGSMINYWMSPVTGHRCVAVDVFVINHAKG